MPYEQSDAKLESLVKQVLDDSDPKIKVEFRDAAARNKIEESVLYSAIKKEADEIWAVVTSELTEYANTETRLQNEEKNLASALPPEPDPDSAPGPKDHTWLLTTSFLMLVGLIFFFYKQGWSGAVRIFGSQLAILLLVTAAILIVTPFVIYSGLQKRSLLRAKRARENLEQSLNKWRETRKALEENTGIDKMRTLLADLSKTIEQSLLEKKIKPKLRVLINKRLPPSYDVEFSVIGHSGLAEVFDPAHAIPTTARQRLKFMMENTPGGSIGIAGPRGAGKTTMMLSYCGPKPSEHTLKNLPILSVLASAPVQYQARDFILYLFSALCNRTLEKLGAPADQSDLREVSATAETLFGMDREGIRRSAKILLYVGANLVVLSLLLAVLLTRYPEAQRKLDSASPATTRAAGNDAQAPAQTEVDASSQTPAESTPAVVRFIRELGLKPIVLLPGGAVVCLLGLVLLFVGRAPKKVQAVAGSTDKSAGTAIAADVEPVAISADAKPPAPLTPADQQLEEARQRLEKAKPTLIDESNKWLRKIKFQQSYTSGWTGALKLPVGLEGGVSSAVTLAENQLSLPEIVHNFTKFVSQLSTHYQVIIGIDELDKLESDEKAQRFLNEIKSIFGLERCFYLISVSENAMSSFERRGLPFRDVFDSSFDSIIYVDYLNFSGAKKLLGERVTGKPIPFFALSYCLAGGLPRDLIRNFRAVIELSEREQPNGDLAEKDLSTLCKNLVKEDLKGKVRAVGVAAKRLGIEPEAGRFLESAYKLDTDSLTPEHLLNTVPSLLLEKQIPIQNNDAAKNLFKKHEELTVIKRELTVYSYYLMTLLEFFNKDLTQSVLEPAEQVGQGLDVLARARQALAMDPNITKELLDQFREQHDMKPLPALPAHPQPAPVP